MLCSIGREQLSALEGFSVSWRNVVPGEVHVLEASPN